MTAEEMKPILNEMSKVWKSVFDDMMGDKTTCGYAVNGMLRQALSCIPDASPWIRVDSGRVPEIPEGKGYVQIIVADHKNFIGVWTMWNDTAKIPDIWVKWMYIPTPPND